MTTEEPAASTSQPQHSEAKKRSPLERAIVWGAIVLLGLVVGLEYRGKTGYDESLSRLQDALEKNRAESGVSTFALEDATEMLSMAPSVSDPVDGRPPEVVVDWFTILRFLPGRTYRIHLELDKLNKDAHVIGVATAADRQLIDANLGQASVTQPDASEGPPGPDAPE